MLSFLRSRSPRNKRYNQKQPIQRAARSVVIDALEDRRLMAIPSAPINVFAETETSTQNNVSWTDTASNETGFKVMRSTDGVNFTTVATVATPNSNYWRDFNAVTGTTYWYGVRSYNAEGASSYPTDKVQTAKQLPFHGRYEPGSDDETPHALPANLEVEHFDKGGQGISHSDNTVPNEGAKYRNVRVDIESTIDTGGGYHVGFTKAGEWLEYTINVPSAATYSPQVRVANSATGGGFHLEFYTVDGSGNQSATPYLTTGSTSVPNTGGLQTFTTINLAGVSLSAGTQVMRLVMDSVSSTSTIAGNFNHLALNSAADTQPPTTPANLNVDQRTATSVSFSWAAASDNVAVTAYEIRIDDELIATLPANQLSFTHTGLTPNTGYFYLLQAVDAAGNRSEVAALGTSTTADTTAPASPTNLVKTAASETSITLSWSAATDDVAVAGYRVFRDGELVGEVTGTELTDTGLDSDTAYTYSVAAVDAAGNVSSSSASSPIETEPDGESAGTFIDVYKADYNLYGNPQLTEEFSGGVTATWSASKPGPWDATTGGASITLGNLPEHTELAVYLTAAFELEQDASDTDTYEISFDDRSQSFTVPSQSIGHNINHWLEFAHTENSLTIEGLPSGFDPGEKHNFVHVRVELRHPYVQITTRDTAVEGQTPAPGNEPGFFIARNGDHNLDELKVKYAVETSENAAEAGTDYSTLSGTATIPAGQPNVFVPLTVLNDEVPEWTESIDIKLLDNGSDYYLPNWGPATTAHLEIVDEDLSIELDSLATSFGPAIRKNNNDDNGNGVPDLDDLSAASDPDLYALRLEFPDVTKGSVTLSTNSNEVKVWTSPSKGGSPILGDGATSTALTGAHDTLYVEAVNSTEDFDTLFTLAATESQASLQPARPSTRAADTQAAKFGVALKRVLFGQGIPDITSAKDQRVIIGERIALNLDVTPARLQQQNPQYQWNVTGNALQSYVASVNVGVPLPVQTENFNASFNFFWVDGTFAGRNENVSASVTFGGHTENVRSDFLVVEPTARITTKTGATMLRERPGNDWVMSFGRKRDENGEPYGTDGIEFHREDFAMPQGFTGKTFWVQTVDLVARRNAVGAGWEQLKVTPGTALDGNFSDPANPDWRYETNETFTTDTPETSGFDATKHTDRIRNDDFIMYLMFQPDSAESKPVPLRKVRWFWTGHASWNALTNKWDLIYGNNSDTPTDEDANVHPQWTHHALGDIAADIWIPD